MRRLAHVLACLAIAAPAAERPIVFEDATGSSELAKRLVGIMNHAAACGDVDGDGSLDLYIGTFCDRPAALHRGSDGPAPNILLQNKGGRFADSGQEPKAHFGLGSAARCDIHVTLPFGKGVLARRDVAADQRLTVSEE